MSSNIKPKGAAKEAPTEPFKRAVGICLKAIAAKSDLEVSFASERPGLVGGKARLPEPPRRLNEREAAIVRGHADSIALRLACHDPAVHRKLTPGGQQARAVFEAVEQARVEAIGARRMGGVAKNLSAMLDDRFHRGKFDEITDRADAPIEDALAMMVRERLTGQSPPGRKLPRRNGPRGLRRRSMRRPPRWLTMPKWRIRKAPRNPGARVMRATSRVGRIIGRSRRASTRWLAPRNYASPKSSIGCA